MQWETGEICCSARALLLGMAPADITARDAANRTLRTVYGHTVRGGLGPTNDFGGDTMTSPSGLIEQLSALAEKAAREGEPVA
jgi:hypothetical protein